MTEGNESILASSRKFSACDSATVIVRRLEIPPPPAVVSKHTHTHTHTLFVISSSAYIDSISCCSKARHQETFLFGLLE